MRLIWAWLRPYLIPKWPHPTLQAEALEDWRASARSVNHTLTQHGSSFYFQKRYFFTLNTKQYMYLMGENVTVWPRISLVRPNSAIFTQYYWDRKCVCHFHIGASPLPLRSATPIQVISNLGNLDVQSQEWPTWLIKNIICSCKTISIYLIKKKDCESK